MEGKRLTVKQWIERFQSLPGSMFLEQGAKREGILQYVRKNGFQIPEDYLEFIELANGARLFNGKVDIWKIPVDGSQGIPEWKSMEYMNSPSVKKNIPFTQNVFLFAGNYLGDYIGFCADDTEYDVIYISPEVDDYWNYVTFTDWLEATWEDMDN